MIGSCSACGRKVGGKHGAKVCADVGGYVGAQQGPRVFCTACSIEWLVVCGPTRKVRRLWERGNTKA